jgi:hypothetical protein
VRAASLMSLSKTLVAMTRPDLGSKSPNRQLALRVVNTSHGCLATIACDTSLAR